MDEGERAIFNNQPVVLDVLLASKRFTVDMFLHMLEFAASCNRYECVRVLLKYEAKVDQVPPRRGYTILFIAARDGANKSIHILIQNGANVNEVNPFSGRTPLHAAAYRGHVKCVKTLINAKANTEVVDHEDHTPLDDAISVVHLEIIKLFVDAGCKGYTYYDHWTNQFVLQRKRTKRTIIAVIGSIRRILGRDMGNLVGSLVWERRDNQAWERAFFQ